MYKKDLFDASSFPHQKQCEICSYLTKLDIKNSLCASNAYFVGICLDSYKYTKFPYQIPDTWAVNLKNSYVSHQQYFYLKKFHLT